MVDFIIIHFNPLVLTDISLERSLVHFLYLLVYSLIQIFLPGGFFIIMSPRGHFFLYCRFPQYLQSISCCISFWTLFTILESFPDAFQFVKVFFKIWCLDLNVQFHIQIDQPRTLWDNHLHCIWSSVSLTATKVNLWDRCALLINGISSCQHFFLFSGMQQ